MPSTMSRLTLAAVAATAATALAFSANAQPYWYAFGGDWSDPSRWTSKDGQQGLPGDGESATLIVGNGREVVFSDAVAPVAPSLLSVFGSDDGTGRLLITGGSLDPDAIQIGNSAYQLVIKISGLPDITVERSGGVIHQTGGQVGANQTVLYVNAVTGPDGPMASRYELIDGTLGTSRTRITGEGAALVQTGGLHVARSVVNQTRSEDPPGYDLQGGMLEVGELDGGHMRQTGGQVVAGSMNLGTYRWIGGELTVHDSLAGGAGAQLQFPDAATQFNLGGLIDVRPQAFVNNSQTTADFAPYSLMIIDPGENPLAGFSAVNNAPRIHTRGDVLTMAPGDMLRIGGLLRERLAIAGGTLDASAGHVEVTGSTTSTISGGNFSVRTLALDHAPRGSLAANRFEQTGGTVHALEQLWIEGSGDYEAPTEYRLFNGVLQADGGIWINGYRRTIDGATNARLVIDSGLLTGSSIGFVDGGVFELSGGSVQVGELATGYMSMFGFLGSGRIEITDPSAEIVVTETLHLTGREPLSAAPGSAIHMKGADFRNRAHYDFPAGFPIPPISEANWSLGDLRLIFEGMDEAMLYEAAGLDLDGDPAGFDDPQTLGVLQIGDGAAGHVQLVNLDDNNYEVDLPEAVYVDELILGSGSILDLNGFNLYYRTFTDLGGTVHLNGGQMMQIIPEPAGAVVLAFAAVVLAARRRHV